MAGLEYFGLTVLAVIFAAGVIWLYVLWKYGGR